MMRLVCVVFLVSSIAVADEEVVRPSAGSAAPPPAGGYAPRPKVGVGIKTAPPGPPAEVAALAKSIAGTWQCKGNISRGDGSSSPLTATVTHKLALDGAWIATTLTAKTGPLKSIEYRTYDPAAKQWSLIQLTNTGAHLVSTSSGEQGGTWTWTGAGTRDYEERVGVGWKLRGEVQGAGPGWSRTYELTCQK